MKYPHLKKKIDWLLDPVAAKIDMDNLPTKEDFFEIWKRLKVDHKRVVSAAIQGDTIADVISNAPVVTFDKFLYLLETSAYVSQAIIVGRMLNLTSHVEKVTYLDVLSKNERSRKKHSRDITKMVWTDKDHLEELAKQVKTTGDGKREVLKQLIAYGMQTKMHTPATVDESSGQIIAPPVFELADPRITIAAMQELNKMDHEYDAEPTSTSSAESTAERIKRVKANSKMNPDKLATMVNRAAKKMNKRMGVEADVKAITGAEVAKELDSE